MGSPAVEEGEFEGFPDAMEGVGDAVDAADFGAVVGWDGDFGDTVAGFEELDDDLGIEVPVPGEAAEGNLAEGIDGVGAVTGVEFGEGGADEAVFDEGEDAVADEFVEGHISFSGGAGDEHSGAHDHIGGAVFEGGEEVLHDFGGVLTVAVEEDDEIEVAVHGVLIAAGLVSAVHEVDGVSEDGEFGALEFFLHFEGDGVGIVLGGVVEDEDFVDFGFEGGWDAMEDGAQGGFGVVGDDEDSDARSVHGRMASLFVVDCRLGAVIVAGRLRGATRRRK